MSIYGDELDDNWDAESVHDEAPIGELELRLPALLSVQLLVRCCNGALHALL